jgi:hypothetical protein
MASEIEIREAIVDRMKSALSVFDPAPTVLGRDISGILESGSFSGLLGSSLLAVSCRRISAREERSMNSFTT